MASGTTNEHSISNNPMLDTSVMSDAEVCLKLNINL